MILQGFHDTIGDLLWREEVHEQAVAAVVDQFLDRLRARTDDEAPGVLGHLAQKVHPCEVDRAAQFLEHDLIPGPQFQLLVRENEPGRRIRCGDAAVRPLVNDFRLGWYRRGYTDFCHSVGHCPRSAVSSASRFPRFLVLSRGAVSGVTISFDRGSQSITT